MKKRITSLLLIAPLLGALLLTSCGDSETGKVISEEKKENWFGLSSVKIVYYPEYGLVCFEKMVTSVKRVGLGMQCWERNKAPRKIRDYLQLKEDWNE